jgi:Activator of Hsp90 ATPase homolog 1-like protein
MSPTLSDQSVQTLEVTQTVDVAAPIDIVFGTILEQMGPLNEGPDGRSMQMKIEPWPGGRWFRDLGNNSGHLWGHVQSIKAPTLLEIHGPLFMSAPAISHVLYRLTSENGGTRIQFSHRAVGQIAPELRDGVNVNKGWGSLMQRIRESAEQKKRS